MRNILLVFLRAVEKVAKIKINFSTIREQIPLDSKKVKIIESKIEKVLMLGRKVSSNVFDHNPSE